LNTPGWKHFRRTANNDKGKQILANAAKPGKFKCEPFWKFGFLIPRVHSQAMELDRASNNTKWNDAEDIERN
jgi:Reverse transcriptase (RNA-dependent DNA polymerase)